MTGFIIPKSSLYHNLTENNMYEIIKVERDTFDTFHFYFYDDNNKLTILTKTYKKDDSFEVYWCPMGA